MTTFAPGGGWLMAGNQISCHAKSIKHTKLYFVEKKLVYGP